MFSFLLGTGLLLTSTAVQILYPAFRTWETINSNTPSRQWLSYWVIYSLLLLVETLTINLSAHTITLIPKVLFCLWLIHPNFLGASYLHENVLDQAFQLADKTVGPYLKPLLNKKEKSE